jgi:LemA protein
MAKNPDIHEEKPPISPFLIVGVILLIIILIPIVWFFAIYNHLISLEQQVEAQWAQVEVQYQRRADLIPNLISSVQGYMTYEQSLLTNITQLRSQWAVSTTLKEKIQTASELESSLSRLLLVMENYPELKADQTVQQLMDELAGTENRVSVERARFNDKVREFNTAIKVFPNNIVADMFNYKEKLYFESLAGAEEVPEVNI